MKILLINGSPRKDGNSDIVCQMICENIDYETIFVRKLKISGCINCEYCYSHSCCYIQDDMQIVYKKIQEAEKIIVVSPIYFYNVPSQLKILIDRCQCFWVKKYIKKEELPNQRSGFIIFIAGAGGEKVFKGAHLTIKYFFDVFNIKIWGEWTIKGINRKGEIKKYPAELDKVVKLCKSFIQS